MVMKLLNRALIFNFIYIMALFYPKSKCFLSTKRDYKYFIPDLLVLNMLEGCEGFTPYNVV